MSENNSPVSHNYYLEYPYVDVHSAVPFRSKWTRIRVDEIDKFRQEHNNLSVFATIQYFAQAVRVEGENVYVGLFFDLDDDKNGGEQARLDCLKIRDWLYQGLQLLKEEVRFYYSAGRGFHIHANPMALGIIPSPNLHKYFEEIGFILKEEMGLPTLDTAVYSSRRQWRLLDSKHEKSGRYKIELDPAELDKPIKEIQAMAAKPRGSLYIDESISLNESAQSNLEPYFRRARIIVSEQKERMNIKQDIQVLKGVPACIKDLREKSIRRPGDRRRGIAILGTFYKDRGQTLDEAIKRLVPWARAIPAELVSTKGKQLDESTIGYARTIYENEKYHFQCPLVWGLNKTLSKEKRIACDGKTCHLHPSYILPKSHAELVKEKIEPPKFIVTNCLPEQGRCIVSASTNIGKTFFVQNLAVKIASGGTEFLNRFNIENPQIKRRILYVDAEMGLPLVMQRLNAMTASEGIEPLENLYIRNIYDMDLKRLEDKIKIEYWLKAIKPNILILDPTSGFWHGSENDQQEVALLTSYLNTLTDKFELAIIIIRHWKKRTKDFKSGGEMASGSHQFLDWTDFHICLKEKANGIIISCEKSRGVKHFEPFLTKINTDTLWFEFLTDFKQEFDETTLVKLFDEFRSNRVALPELVKLATQRKICSKGTIRKLAKDSPNFEIDDSGRTHFLVRKSPKNEENGEEEAEGFFD